MGVNRTSVQCFSPRGIAFVECGKRENPQVVLIHGAPGSASEWAAFMELETVGESWRCLAIDRPGYGSTPAIAKAGEIHEQVEVLAESIIGWAETEKPLCVVGHSYGAPLAALLALRLKNDLQVSGIVLVAGVLDPNRKHFRWYHSLLESKILASIFGSSRQRSAAEMKHVSVALDGLADDWQHIKVPVRLIHAANDWVVDYGNSEYVLHLLGQGIGHLHRVESAGHDLPQMRADLIFNCVTEVFSLAMKGAETS